MAKKSSSKDNADQPDKQDDSANVDSDSPQASHNLQIPFSIVGVGASAGGLKALQELVAALPKEPGLSLVVIQHLDPTKDSLSAELLSRQTSLTVEQVQGDLPVKPNHIYVIPPNKYLRIEEGILRLSVPEQRRGIRVPIDFFLRSLAAEQREHSVAVILSGTGSDGTLGAKAVKSQGGLVIVQDRQSAEHAGMPESVLATGIVDFELLPGEISETLVRYAQSPKLKRLPVTPVVDEGVEKELNAIIDLLRSRGNHDFRNYKQATILRRARRRMGLLNIHDLSEYQDYLRDHSDEIEALVKDFLISVTDFFREPEAWKTLEEDVIIPLLERKEPDAPIRVWVSGCATGEEPYSITMLLLDHMQRLGQRRPLQVFASDIDRAALDYARQGRYPSTIETDIRSERLRRYFVHETGDHHYLVSKALREPVVFAEQNLISDPPYSRLDLICCRNLMIYLKGDIQQKIIGLFHFALAENGCLFLGNAETIGRQEDLFKTVSQKWRIYRRIGASRSNKVDFPLVGGPPKRGFEPIPVPAERRDLRLAHLAQERLLDWIAPAAVLVDAQGTIHYYSGETDAFLTHSAGMPTQSLFSKARQGLRTKLRGVIQTALKDGKTISLDARVKRDGTFHPLRLTARPINDPQHGQELVLIMFEELNTTGKQAHSTSEERQEETEIDTESIVRHLEDELALTKEDLQTSIEQLESSNEEFKVSNEEVMSINEELQSTNEELETSKEELQSLNEELNTVNCQLAAKVEELQTSNDDLANLLSSTDLATICLDRDLHIKWFTPATNRLVNLVSSDIDRPLSDFSHRFSNDGLLQDAQQVLDRLTPREDEVTTTDGSTYLRRITPYRTEDDRILGVVLTFVDITAYKRMENKLGESEDLRRLAVDAGRLGTWEWDLATGEVSYIDSEAELLGLKPGSLITTIDEFYKIVHPDDLSDLKEALRRTIEQGEVYDHEFRVVHKNGDIRWLAGRGEMLRGEAELPMQMFGINYDITVRKHAELELLQTKEQLTDFINNATVGLRWVAPDGSILWANRCELELLGYAEDEYIGHNIFEFHVDQDVLMEIVKRLQNDEVIQNQTVRMRCKDGTIKQVLLNSDVYRVNGEFIHTRCFTRDVTRRFEAEEKLKRLNESLEQEVSGRIEALGVLHDVTIIANEADTTEGGIRETLKAVCEYNSWLIGHAWLRDDGRMTSTDIWHVRPDIDNSEIQVSKFQQMSANSGIPAEASLVRKVLSTEQACWVEDLKQWKDSSDGSFESLGIRAAIAFPVWSDGEIAAVLECFSDQPLSKETQFMEVMTDVGIQLGHLIERKRLESSVAEAVSAQQRHFAQELHDSIAQELMGVQLLAGSLHRRLKQVSPNEATELEDLINHLNETQQQIRRLSRGLMPVEVDPAGLAHALEELTERCNGVSEIDCIFEESPTVTVDHSETSTEIYRIAQEAIQNAVKHSEGSRIVVSLKYKNGDIVLTVQDDGKGYSPAVASRGTGQRIMRYRANLIGATLTIDSTPGNGTTITCRLPKPS